MKSRKSQYKHKLENKADSKDGLTSQHDINENSSFFKVNESGIKRLKKFEKSRVKGDNPFAVCMINKNERNDHENLYIADYLVTNVDFFNSLDLDLIPYIAKQLSAFLFK